MTNEKEFDMNVTTEVELNLSGGKVEIVEGVQIDETLTIQGAAADAKTVGDALEKKVDKVEGKDLTTLKDGIGKNAIIQQAGDSLSGSGKHIAEATADGNTSAAFNNGHANGQSNFVANRATTYQSLSAAFNTAMAGVKAKQEHFDKFVTFAKQKWQEAGSPKYYYRVETNEHYDENEAKTQSGLEPCIETQNIFEYTNRNFTELKNQWNEIEEEKIVENHWYDTVVDGNVESGYNDNFFNSLAFAVNEGKALGKYSFASGTSMTDELAKWGFAIGSSTKVTAPFAFVGGQNSIADAIGSFCFGRPSSTREHKTEGEDSVAIGRGCLALALCAIAMGCDADASGEGAVSIGYKTKAKGKYAAAFNGGSEAKGSYSLACNYGSYAEGTGSFAANLSKALKNFAASFGNGTIANYWAQMVCGEYNAQENAHTYFIVGNGTDDKNRSNAFAVYKDGRAKIGAAPKDRMDVVNKDYTDKGLWLKEYDPTYPYQIGELTIKHGVIYKSTINANIGNSPDADINGYWEDLLSGKLSKNGWGGSNIANVQLYGKEHTSGYPTMYNLTVVPLRYGVARYNADARLQTQTPGVDLDCTNKKYVDDGLAGKVAAIDEPSKYYSGVPQYVYTHAYNTDKTVITPMRANTNPTSGALVMWGSEKQIKTNKPTLDEHCANKKYVDDNFVQKLVAHNITIKCSEGITNNANEFELRATLTNKNNAYQNIEELAGLVIENSEYWDLRGYWNEETMEYEPELRGTYKNTTIETIVEIADDEGRKIAYLTLKDASGKVVFEVGSPDMFGEPSFYIASDIVESIDYQKKIDTGLETKSKELVGAINEINDGKLDKVEPTTNSLAVYSVSRVNGVITQGTTLQQDSPTFFKQWMIPRYMSQDSGATLNQYANGTLIVPEPKLAYHCANKKYVDDKIAEVGGGSEWIELPYKPDAEWNEDNGHYEQWGWKLKENGIEVFGAPDWTKYLITINIPTVVTCIEDETSLDVCISATFVPTDYFSARGMFVAKKYGSEPKLLYWEFSWPIMPDSCWLQIDGVENLYETEAMHAGKVYVTRIAE